MLCLIPHILAGCPEAHACVLKGRGEAVAVSGRGVERGNGSGLEQKYD